MPKGGPKHIKVKKEMWRKLKTQQKFLSQTPV